MKLHPLTIILIGCLICSIGFNLLVIQRNSELEKIVRKPIIIYIYPADDKLRFTGM